VLVAIRTSTEREIADASPDKYRKVGDTEVTIVVALRVILKLVFTLEKDRTAINGSPLASTCDTHNGSGDYAA